MSAITVIMRSKNSDWVIDQTLQALFSQEGVEFALHVVDSGSTDSTLDIVRRYPCTINQISADQYVPGPVLNAAMEQVTTPIAVLLNSDGVLLTPYSIKNILEVFRDPLVDGAYGRQLARPKAEPWVQRDYAASFPANDPAPWIPFSAVFSAIRVASWNKRRFYDQAWGSEDVEWASVHNTRYVPSALCMHSHNYTLRELYQRRYIEGEADAYIGQREVTLRAAFSDSLRDLPWYCKRNQWHKIPLIPIRRFAAALGHRQGWRMGQF